jgi:hypothetical protein
MDKINKPFLCTILIAIFLLFSNIFFIHLWWTKPCDCSGKTVIEWRDSTAPSKDTTHTIINSKPIKISTRRRAEPLQSRVGYSIAQTDSLNAHNSTIDSDSPTCSDTNTYKTDTLSPENFRATATAIVTGNELINLKVVYKNLAPEKWRIETITKTVVQEKRQSLVKVYLGLHVGASMVNKSIGTYRGGGDIDAIIADRHMLGINGGINSNLQPEVGIRFSEKISFRKK